MKLLAAALVALALAGCTGPPPAPAMPTSASLSQFSTPEMAVDVHFTGQASHSRPTPTGSSTVDFAWDQRIHIEGGGGMHGGPATGTYTVNDRQTISSPTGTSTETYSGAVEQKLGYEFRVGGPIHPKTAQPAYSFSAGGYITGSVSHSGGTFRQDGAYLMMVVLTPQSPRGSAEIPVFSPSNDFTPQAPNGSYMLLSVDALNSEDYGEGVPIGTAQVTWRPLHG